MRAAETKWTRREITTADEFAAYMSERGLSQPEAARLLNVAHSTLSPMLSHKYPGDVAGICTRMRQILRRAQLRAVAGKRPTYVTTSITEQVVSACSIAHVEQIISLVIGPSGIGKTAGMLRYCNQDPKAVYVHAGIGASPWSCLKLIAQRVGVPYHSPARQLRSDLAAHMAGTETLLVVDELDFVREPTLQCLRMLHEEAGIGMVWSSTSALLRKLQQTGSPTLRQVMRRIRFVARLTYCSRDDIERVLASYRLDTETLDAVVGDAAGEVDRAISVIVRALSMRNGEGRVTPALVHKAYETLPPPDKAGRD